MAETDEVLKAEAGGVTMTTRVSITWGERRELITWPLLLYALTTVRGVDNTGLGYKQVRFYV